MTRKKRGHNERVSEEKPSHTASRTKKHRLTQIENKERDKEIQEWKFPDLRTTFQNESFD